jgi:pSer/pThr/pTyr-binding forkhead associated (FHA) protein
LEHRGGRFQGQRLELKRAIVTIGRGEDNDIWLDDEMASRYHAELAWDQGQVYLTDCDSLNGVLLNGRRIRGSALIEPGELLEIGSHRFIFIQTDSKDPSLELSDPLAHHKWRSSLEPLTMSSLAQQKVLPPTRPLVDNGIHNPATPAIALLSSADVMMTPNWQETAEIEQVAPPPQSPSSGAISIWDGELTGKMFLLDRPFIVVGRGSECDVVIDDVSISRIHVQFSRQKDGGSYVQDLVSRNGTKVNGEPLMKPHLLVQGDVVCIGNIRLEYIEVTTASTIPLSFVITPHPFMRSMSGPVPLRLPSKPKL